MRKPQKSTDHPVHSIFEERYSPRSFQDRPLSEADLHSMLEAARWSPSAFNEQPWRFIYSHLGSGSHERLASLLNEGNQWAKAAPVLMLVMASETLQRNGKPNKHAWHDTGLAVAAMVYQAMSMGIYAHQMGGFDAGLAKDLYHIPEQISPVTMIAFGYPGHAEALEGDLQTKELSPQSRKSLSAFAFEADSVQF